MYIPQTLEVATAGIKVVVNAILILKKLVRKIKKFEKLLYTVSRPVSARFELVGLVNTKYTNCIKVGQVETSATLFHKFIRIALIFLYMASALPNQHIDQEVSFSPNALLGLNHAAKRAFSVKWFDRWSGSITMNLQTLLIAMSVRKLKKKES